MGIIRALAGAVGGSLADQWLEVIEPDNMSDTTVFCKGVAVRKNDRRNANRKGTEDVISNGSVIHVGENEFMLLVDGGKVVDYSAEPGYYKVDNTAAPSAAVRRSNPVSAEGLFHQSAGDQEHCLRHGEPDQLF